jgi:hypothetical protein
MVTAEVGLAVVMHPPAIIELTQTSYERQLHQDRLRPANIYFHTYVGTYLGTQVDHGGGFATQVDFQPAGGTVRCQYYEGGSAGAQVRRCTFFSQDRFASFGLAGRHIQWWRPATGGSSPYRIPIRITTPHWKPFRGFWSLP